jgi:hypothetical protein
MKMDFAMDELEIFRADNPDGATWQLRDIMSFKRARKWQSLYRIRPKKIAAPEAPPAAEPMSSRREAVIAALEGRGIKVDRRKSTETLQEELDDASL